MSDAGRVQHYIRATERLRARCALLGNAKSPSDYLNDQLPSWAHLSGEVRGRLEGISGIGFTSNDDAWGLNRIRLNATINPASWMKFQFEAQDAQVFGRNIKPDGPPHEDTMDLRSAYVDFMDPEKQSFGVRVGRQELVFGEQRLVGHVSWLNTARMDRLPV